MICFNKVKTVKIIKFILAMFVVYILNVSLIFAANNNVKKIISIAYDDSGSMNNKWQDYSYASFALQNLIALMNDNDKLNVVKMSDLDSNLFFHVDNYDKRKNEIEEVKKYDASAEETTFKIVDNAVDYLYEMKNIYGLDNSYEYYFVLITDGKFQDYPDNMVAYLDNVYNEFKGLSYNAIVVAIGNEVPAKLKRDVVSAKNNYYIECGNNEEIVKGILAAHNIIYDRDIIPNSQISYKNDNSNITFFAEDDIKKIIVFEKDQKIPAIAVKSNNKNTDENLSFNCDKELNPQINTYVSHHSYKSNLIKKGDVDIEFLDDIDINKQDFTILVEYLNGKRTRIVGNETDNSKNNNNSENDKTGGEDNNSDTNEKENISDNGKGSDSSSGKRSGNGSSNGNASGNDSDSDNGSWIVSGSDGNSNGRSIGNGSESGDNVTDLFDGSKINIYPSLDKRTNKDLIITDGSTDIVDINPPIIPIVTESEIITDPYDPYGPYLFFPWWLLLLLLLLILSFIFWPHICSSFLRNGIDDYRNNIGLRIARFLHIPIILFLLLLLFPYLGCSRLVYWWGGKPILPIRPINPIRPITPITPNPRPIIPNPTPLPTPMTPTPIPISPVNFGLNVLPFLILGLILGYIIKPRFDKKWHDIQVKDGNRFIDDGSMIKIKKYSKFIPYMAERGLGYDMPIKACFKKDRIKVDKDFLNKEDLIEGKKIENVNKAYLYDNMKLTKNVNGKNIDYIYRYVPYFEKDK